MKLILSPLLVSVTFLCSSALAQDAKSLLPENNQALLVRLSHRAPQADGFTVLSIAVGDRVTELHPASPVLCVPKDDSERAAVGLPAHITGLQLDRSRCFFRGEYGDRRHPHTILVFLSEGFASDAAPVLVVGFHSDGLPFKILEKSEFDPVMLIDSRFGALLIGKPALSEILGCLNADPARDPYAGTYDPYAAYAITPDRSAHYSLAASKAYNQAHYVWAGEHYREDLLVFYNIPGHSRPFVASADRSNNLLPRCH